MKSELAVKAFLVGGTVAVVALFLREKFDLPSTV